jgi:cell division protein FtsW
MKVAVTTLALCVAGLLSLGLVMLYSSGLYHRGADQLSSRFLMAQLLWCAVGMAACVTAATLDYRWLKRCAWPLYGMVVVLLALVLKFGPDIKGAHRWFTFHGISFQPSELAKIVLVIVLAWYCERYQRKMNTWSRGIAIPGLIIGAMLALIFIEPDRGTTILLAAVSGAMLLVAGVRWHYIIPPALAVVAALAISILHDPMRSKRVFSWLNLEENKSGIGYQGYQAMIALGSGGWTGLGLGNGRQKLGWVPEHHTDFILSVIGEELGLVATLGVILGFVLILICGIYIAIHARDTFGTMLATGLTFLIGLQAFINIGVVSGALPNKGIALPFISYGGSSLVAMLGCVGLLFSVARQGRSSEPKPANPFASTELPSVQTP